MPICIIMRRGGRSKRSSRESSTRTIPDRDMSRQTIQRQPYDSRQPTSFRSISGSAPAYNHNLTTPKSRSPFGTTDAKEENE